MELGFVGFGGWRSLGRQLGLRMRLRVGMLDMVGYRQSMYLLGLGGAWDRRILSNTLYTRVAQRGRIPTTSTVHCLSVFMLLVASWYDVRTLKRTAQFLRANFSLLLTYHRAQIVLLITPTYRIEQWFHFRLESRYLRCRQVIP